MTRTETPRGLHEPDGEQCIESYAAIVYPVEYTVSTGINGGKRDLTIGPTELGFYINPVLCTEYGVQYTTVVSLHFSPAVNPGVLSQSRDRKGERKIRGVCGRNGVGTEVWNDQSPTYQRQ